MPDDTITLVSTTDSPAEVQAALTGKPVTPPPADEPPAETAPPADATVPDEPEAPEAPPADETPEQRESREASEHGRGLAKRKAKIQEAIDRDIQRKTAARLDAEAEEARLNELRRQRQELEAAAQPPAAPAAPAAAAAIGRPEPKIDAVGDDGNAKYATYEDYLTDHAAWSREEAILAARKVIDDERQADRARIERESSSRVVNDRLAVFNTALEAFKTTHADFDAVFEDAKDAVQETLVRIGPNALKVIDGYTVFDAKDGPALMYHLLQHPDELRVIALKPQAQQLIELARLDERLRPATAPPKRSGPVAKAPDTKAPEPIRPVGSGPTATTVSLDEESYQDYKSRRNRELRSRAGL